MSKPSDARLDRMLRKSRLRQAYGKTEDAAQRRAVVMRYGELLRENPAPNRALTSHLQGAILPAIALRQIAGGSSLKSIHGSVMETSQPMRRMFRALSRLPFFFALFRVLCKKSMPAVYGEGGWQFVWNTSTPTEIQWDCVRCIYKDVFEKYAVPELTPIFCAADDVIYGDIPGARWARTKTLGRGGDVCDFRFVKEP